MEKTEKIHHGSWLFWREDLNPSKLKSEILGLKHEDRLSNPFFELVQKRSRFVFRACFGVIISWTTYRHCKSWCRSDRWYTFDESAPALCVLDLWLLETWLILSGTKQYRQYHESNANSTIVWGHLPLYYFFQCLLPRCHAISSKKTRWWWQAMAPHPIPLPGALAFPPPSHRDATTPSPCWAPHFITRERIMFSNPTQSEPRLSPAATTSDATPSSLTPPLHCASILQPTAPPQVVAFDPLLFLFEPNHNYYVDNQGFVPWRLRRLGRSKVRSASLVRVLSDGTIFWALGPQDLRNPPPPTT